ncbi:MAG TPA: hypothetical protein VK012_03230 [Gemmatimonadales bacterium]|nr:hypothetical protein [Gemmatimonadales bacterium]
MHRFVSALVMLAAGLPVALAAQSSQFGIRGLGFPGRSTSVLGLGAGGAFAGFDATSSTNPAALGELRVFTASFTVLQNYRSSRVVDVSQSGRDTRFPQMAVGGPVIGTPLALGVSFSNLTDRDFILATSSTVPIRGTPVEVDDTLTSTGGLSDLRFAGAYDVAGWSLGAGVHIITGSNRVQLRRTFADSVYAPVSQRSEISYAAAGFSAGVSRPVGTRLAVNATFRINGSASVDRDSARVAEIDLPVSFGAGIMWRPSPRLRIAGQALARQWGSADEALRALGGTGAVNTIDLAAGLEYTRNARRPLHQPIRFGARFATLPFPVESGARVREFGLSIGTGLRFAQDRLGIDHAGVDLSLERVWRGSRGGLRENAWLLGIGVTVRP